MAAQKKMDANLKGILIALGVVGVGFAVYKINKFIEKQKQNAKATTNLNTQGDELHQLFSQGIKPTYPQSQYNTWANMIAQQLNGCYYSFNDIWNVINKIKNDADFLMLAQAFGSRTSKGCMLASDFTGGLADSLHWKLFYFDYARLNNYLANVTKFKI